MSPSVKLNNSRYQLIKSSESFNSTISKKGLEWVIGKIIRPNEFHILKAGNTATVYIVQLDNKEYVVKRYNIKNKMAWIKRQFVSRAKNSDMSAGLLRAASIKTPESIALIKQKNGVFSGIEYLVTEVAQGKILSELKAEELISHGLEQNINELFKKLLFAKLSHGDMKATNLFVDNDIVLIDLDSMKFHKTFASAAKALSRDRDRLLRNWPESSLLPDLIRLPSSWD